MNKQEVIEQVKNKALHHCGEKECYKDGCEKSVELNTALEIINQIDEPQKVVIPKSVADFISRIKTSNFGFRNYHGYEDWLSGTDDVFRVMYYILKEGVAGYTIKSWVDKNKDAFARAWLDGYEVEKEKLYTVEIPDPNGTYTYRFLTRKSDGSVFIEGNSREGWRNWKSCQLTESEIKQDFDWAWQWAKPVEE